MASAIFPPRLFDAYSDDIELTYHCHVKFVKDVKQLDFQVLIDYSKDKENKFRSTLFFDVLQYIRVVQQLLDKIVDGLMYKKYFQMSGTFNSIVHNIRDAEDELQFLIDGIHNRKIETPDVAEVINLFDSAVRPTLNECKETFIQVETYMINYFIVVRNNNHMIQFGETVR